MQVAYLDASKAFDLVNHTKFVRKLTERGIPKWIIRCTAIATVTSHCMASGAR